MFCHLIEIETSSMPSMPVKFKISSTRSELKPCQAQRKMRAAAREMDEADENHEDGDRALREEEDSDDAKTNKRGRGRGRGRGTGKGRGKGKAKGRGHDEEKPSETRKRPASKVKESEVEGGREGDASREASPVVEKRVAKKLRASAAKWSPRKRQAPSTAEAADASSLPSKRTKQALEKAKAANQWLASWTLMRWQLMRMARRRVTGSHVVERRLTRTVWIAMRRS